MRPADCTTGTWWNWALLSWIVNASPELRTGREEIERLRIG